MSKQSIYASLMAIAGSRSKVLVPDPGYFYTEPILLGGMKLSGLGREGIRFAIEEMTEIKLAIFRK